MNERIKELYLHAFPPSLNDSTVCQMSAEKFAEMIVKDAMQVVANQLPSNQYLDVAHAVIEHYKDADVT